MSQEKLIEDDPTFQRQRRLLLLISMVLVFYVLTGVEISEISVFGNTAELQSQRGVGVFLWVLWGYWLIRCYQSFTEQDISGMEAAIKKREITPLLLCAKWMAPRDEDFIKHAIEDTSITDPKVSLVRNGMFEQGIKAPGVRWVKAEVSVYNRGNKMGPSVETMAGPYPVNEMMNSFIRGYSKGRTMLETRFFTEFFLPFVVAATPVIVCVLKRWTSLI